MSSTSSLESSANRDLFALDENYDSLDDCLDSSLKPELMSISSLIRGHQKATKRPKTANLRPVVFLRFNTQRGKAKPVTITALLDSGGHKSLVTERLTKKLKVKSSKGKAKVWSTPAGDVTTNKRVKSQFTMPELHEDCLVEWDFHVTKSLGA